MDSNNTETPILDDLWLTGLSNKLGYEWLNKEFVQLIDDTVISVAEEKWGLDDAGVKQYIQSLGKDAIGVKCDGWGIGGNGVRLFVIAWFSMAYDLSLSECPVRDITRVLQIRYMINEVESITGVAFNTYTWYKTLIIISNIATDDPFAEWPLDIYVNAFLFMNNKIGSLADVRKLVQLSCRMKYIMYGQHVESDSWFGEVGFKKTSWSGGGYNLQPMYGITERENSVTPIHLAYWHDVNIREREKLLLLDKVSQDMLWDESSSNNNGFTVNIYWKDNYRYLAFIEMGCYDGNFGRYLPNGWIACNTLFISNDKFNNISWMDVVFKTYMAIVEHGRTKERIPFIWYGCHSQPDTIINVDLASHILVTEEGLNIAECIALRNDLVTALQTYLSSQFYTVCKIYVTNKSGEYVDSGLVCYASSEVAETIGQEDAVRIVAHFVMYQLMNDYTIPLRACSSNFYGWLYDMNQKDHPEIIYDKECSGMRDMMNMAKYTT